MTELRYREHQPGPRWLRAVGVFCVAILLPVSAVMANAVAQRWGTGSALWVLACMVFFIVAIGLASLICLANTIDIRVTHRDITGLVVPLRVFRIHTEEITAIEPATVTPTHAGGIGYRVTPSARYLLFNAGPAVRITTRTGRIYVVRSLRPDALIAAIEPAKAPRQ
ncbi:hypothetical protein [Glaciihabitans sp. dw_435]|uniref:hypothetical protein n=1 Tax=Glaciihabitans sp. dw_435 TaxID=2720081 RepID=UPI001BD35618|nr:hypothetical protein [Glaciihabitans sp. dw_435]